MTIFLEAAPTRAKMRNQVTSLLPFLSSCLSVFLPLRPPCPSIAARFQPDVVWSLGMVKSVFMELPVYSRGETDGQQELHGYICQGAPSPQGDKERLLSCD